MRGARTLPDGRREVDLDRRSRHHPGDRRPQDHRRRAGRGRHDRDHRPHRGHGASARPGGGGPWGGRLVAGLRRREVGPDRRGADLRAGSRAGVSRARRHRPARVVAGDQRPDHGEPGPRQRGGSVADARRARPRRRSGDRAARAARASSCRCPRWADYVSLSFDELIEMGAGHAQVRRRLERVLDGPECLGAGEPPVHPATAPGPSGRMPVERTSGGVEWHGDAGDHRRRHPCVGAHSRGRSLTGADRLRALVFTAAGFVAGAYVPRVDRRLARERGGRAVHRSDARAPPVQRRGSPRPRALRHELGWPSRLLLIGLPLTMLAGSRRGLPGVPRHGARLGLPALHDAVLDRRGARPAGRRPTRPCRRACGKRWTWRAASTTASRCPSSWSRSTSRSRAHEGVTWAVVSNAAEQIGWGLVGRRCRRRAGRPAPAGRRRARLDRDASGGRLSRWPRRSVPTPSH